ncbi:MAG: ABC transporter substrate-binding protein [Actinomycetota bacterium]
MLIADLSGPREWIGAPEINARGAIRAIHKAGGLGPAGQRIKLSVCDTKSLAAEAAKCARRAVSDGVVLELSSTTLGDQIIPILEDANIASMNLGFTAEELTATNSFVVTVNFPVLAAQVTILADQGAESVHPVISDLGPATDQAVQTMQAAAEAAGITWDGHEVMPLDAVDMAPFVEAAAGDDVDGIPVTILGPNQAAFVVEFRRAGKDQLLSATPSLLTGSEGLGDDANGVYVVSGQRPYSSSDPGVKRYVKHMNAVDDDRGYRDFLDANMYVAMFALAEAAENLSEITAETVLEAMSAVDNLDLGIVAPLNFSQPSVCFPLPRQFACQFDPLRIRKGKLVELTGEFQDPFRGPEDPS